MDAKTITLQLNGEQHALPPNSTLIDLLSTTGIDPKANGTAIGLNGSMVPRTNWPGTTLKDGDRVDLVCAQQGG